MAMIAAKALISVCAAMCAWCGSMAREARFSYRDAESSSWEEVRVGAMPFGRSPLSVHVPVGLPEAADLLFCDCAFNAWKLPVPPDLKTGDPKGAEILRDLRVGLVSVALDEAPFVPEFRQTRWTRRAGGLPIVRGELDAKYRSYSFEYCTHPDTGELYIRGTVRNAGDKPGKAVIRLRKSAPREQDVCDYHYITFRWDADKWKTGDPLPPPQVVENDFETAGEEASWSFGDDAYGMGENYWGAPYYVHPAMRLRTGGGVVRFETDLKPGEERSFTVAAGFADRPPERHPPFAETVAAAERHWMSRLSVKADFGSARVNDIFRSLQFSELQLLLNPWKDPASSYLQPCQGGSSERFYVWVWEAMEALRPMTRLGYDKEIRKVLEYILRLQDGGCPPKGDFTTLSGAIGTTGPRWANTTGAALMLAADYLVCSEDKDFERKHLSNLIRAAKWILGETAATRRLDAQGKKIVGYGLMPGCVANDGDRGLFFATTDSYSYAGVRRLVDVLESLSHPEAARLRTECARYKADIDAAIVSVQRPDGFIPRVIGADAGGSFEFRNIPASLCFLAAGVSDAVTDTALPKMVRYWEQERADGPFARPFDFGIRYIGNSETCLCRYHTQRGEWKSAYFAREAALNYAMTRDLWITGERYSEVDEGFVPWQPNASNCGRLLGMLADRFLLEGESRIVLLGGFAPFENGDVSMVGLRTRFGRCDIIRKDGKLRVEWERDLPVGVELVLPAHHHVVPVGQALKKTGDETWVVVNPARVLQWR